MRGPFQRAILVVLDGVGIGAMPDAGVYGDEGRDTLGHIAEQKGLSVPHLVRLGLGNIRPLVGLTPPASPDGAYGKSALLSPGKDTTTGHWEMAGVILERAFPTYPRGFPSEIIERFEQTIGRKTLGNIPASGTEIIKQLGEEHVRTGRPIVYTSADSVFQRMFTTLAEWASGGKPLFSNEVCGAQAAFCACLQGCPGAVVL
jgi:phosphopentomutase